MRKPDPDLFLEAMSRLGLDATAAIIVGRQHLGYAGGAAGARAGVGVLSGGYGQDELKRQAPTVSMKIRQAFSCT